MKQGGNIFSHHHEAFGRLYQLFCCRLTIDKSDVTHSYPLPTFLHELTLPCWG